MDDDSNTACHIAGLDTMLGSLWSAKLRLTAVHLDE